MKSDDPPDFDNEAQLKSDEPRHRASVAHPADRKRPPESPCRGEVGVVARDQLGARRYCKPWLKLLED